MLFGINIKGRRAIGNIITNIIFSPDMQQKGMVFCLMGFRFKRYHTKIRKYEIPKDELWDSKEPFDRFLFLCCDKIKKNFLKKSG